MPPRSTFSGSIGFGLVNIPIKLYTAIEERGTSLNLAHKGCGGDIGQKRYCKAEDKLIEWSDCDRAFPVSKDKKVILTDQDLARLPLKSSKTVEIVGFLEPEDQPDPIYFGSSYYVTAGDGGEKAFALLAGVMREGKQMAVAKIAMRQRERQAIVRITPEGRVLLSLLAWGDEVRDDPAYDLNEAAVSGISDKEIDMARQLIAKMRLDEYDPTESRDTWREALVALVNAKLEGKEVETVVGEEPTFGDLSAALAASLETAPEKN